MRKVLITEDTISPMKIDETSIKALLNIAGQTALQKLNETLSIRSNYENTLHIGAGLRKQLSFLKVWDHNLLKDTFLGESVQRIDVNNKMLLMTVPLMERKDKNGETMTTDGTVSYKVCASNNLQFM